MKKMFFFCTLLTLWQPLLWAQSAISVQISGKGAPVLFLPGFATPGEV